MLPFPSWFKYTLWWFLKIHINIIIGICFTQLLKFINVYPSSLDQQMNDSTPPIVGSDFRPWKDICVSAEIMKSLCVMFSFLYLCHSTCREEVMLKFSTVQSLSHVQLFVNPWTTERQGSLSITNSWSLTKLMSVMPSNHLILCRPLLLCPQSFPASGSFQMSQLFTSSDQSIGVSASASVLPMNPGLISFRMDWLDLLAVQGTLNSLLQHHSSKASILQRSAFLIIQLSYPYMTYGKTIALTRQIFVHKVMSLLFNMLSRLVITFLPRTKRLLISWLHSPSAVILELKK